MQSNHRSAEEVEYESLMMLEAAADREEALRAALREARKELHIQQVREGTGEARGRALQARIDGLAVLF